MGGMRKILEFSDRLPAAKGVDVAHTAMSCASPALAACAATRVRTRGEGAARWRLPPSRSGVAPRAAQSATANPARGKDVSPEELAEQSLEACGWGELLEDLAEYASTRLGLVQEHLTLPRACLLYTSPSPRD